MSLEGFDHPLARLAEGLAFDAERLERQGKREEARSLYARAADATRIAAEACPERLPRTKAELRRSLDALLALASGP